jgi:hypothetical protein
MDPNTALEHILCGSQIAEHAEALESWLLSGGFEPEPIWLPVDTTPEFAANFAQECDIHATRQGLEQDGELVYSWAHLKLMEDDHEGANE